MAFSHRIITQRTRLFAAILAVGVLATAFLFAEMYPGRPLQVADAAGQPQIEAKTRAPRAVDLHPFPPQSVRPDDALCRWTSDQVLRHWGAARDGDDVYVSHAVSVGRLAEAYIEMGCPSRIHDGDWNTAVEILRVGIVVESTAAHPRHGTLIEPLPARADRLVEAAATTFHILSPQVMCREAARGDSQLGPTCDAALRHYY